MATTTNTTTAPPLPYTVTCYGRIPASANEGVTAVKEPVATEDSTVSEQPLVSVQPVVSEQPVMDEEHVEKEAPAVSEQPVVVEEHVDAEALTVPEQAAVDEESVKVEERAESEEPVVYESVGVSQEPVVPETMEQSPAQPGPSNDMDMNQRLEELQKIVEEHVQKFEEQSRRFEDQDRQLEDHRQQLEEQRRINTNLRRLLLNLHTKVVTEAFLSLLKYKGDNRTAFINGMKLPKWVEVWMNKSGLQEEVKLRLVEGPENTTHRTDGREALRAIIEARNDADDNMQEDSFRRLVLMIFVLFEAKKDKNFSYKAGPNENRFAEILENEEEFLQKCKEIEEAEEFDLIPGRPPRPGTRARFSKKVKEVLKLDLRETDK